MSNKKDEYEKMDQREHFLFAPDTYCGGCDPIQEKMFI